MSALVKVPGLDLRPGALLADKYRLDRVLGEGGMGVVWAAHHELLDQPVALKVLFKETLYSARGKARFIAEAKAVARIRSEHVVRVMDIAVAEGTPFIVMEYLEGLDLERLLLQCGPLEPGLVVDYVLQTIEPLAQAHSQQIIHRDLKPSNLFLAERPDGTMVLKVLDFGLAKTLADVGTDGELTSTRNILGSPPYMAPEQLDGSRAVDARTDIWALGVVMYELLAGKRPFTGTTPGVLFDAILNTSPVPIGEVRPAVPSDLAEVVARCLKRPPEERYPDVAALARALIPLGSGTWTNAALRANATLARSFTARASAGNPRAVPLAPEPALMDPEEFAVDPATLVFVPAAPRESDGPGARIWSRVVEFCAAWWNASVAWCRALGRRLRAGAVSGAALFVAGTGAVLVSSFVTPWNRARAGARRLQIVWFAIAAVLIGCMAGSLILWATRDRDPGEAEEASASAEPEAQAAEPTTVAVTGADPNRIVDEANTKPVALSPSAVTSARAPEPSTSPAKVPRKRSRGVLPKELGGRD